MIPNIPKLALSALAVSLLALPTYAQSSDWKVDGNHSSAQIAVETATRGSGNSLTLGVTTPTGILHLNSADPSKSTLQFELRTAGVQSPLIRFRSESAELTPNGQLKVTGKLTVTRVVLVEDLTANEGFSGPVVTGSRVVESSRQESFILPVPAADPRDAKGNAYLAVSTALKLNAEDFPELYDQLLSTNWPAKAQDVVSESPSSFGEDYSGTLRTGSNVQSRSITRTATSFGEDYPGAVADSVQPGNVVTLALNLHLVPQGTQLSARNGQ
jgi:hypothetical protein